MKKIKKNISMIIVLVYTLLNLWFIVNLIRIDILPNAMLFVIIGLSVLFNLFFAIRLIKAKKRKQKKRRIFGSIFCIILLVINVFVTYHYSNTMNFFSLITGKNYNTYTYQLYVLKDSEYESAFDLDGESLGVVDIDTELLDLVLEEVSEDFSYESSSYDSSYEVVVALEDSEVEAILIKDTDYTLLEENDTELTDNLKLLKEYQITVEYEELSSEKDLTNDSFIVYITGYDRYGEISLTALSDVNMLAVVNPTTKEIALVSIPRDYYVEMPGYGTTPDKLTHAGVYGTDVSISTIENLLNIEIDHYLKINFSTIVNFVDIVGPIEVESVYTFCADTYCFDTGTNVLNGLQTLEFVRERYSLPNGDLDRAYNQQLVVNSLIKTMATPSTLTNYSSILESISSYFATSLTDTDIKSLVKMQLSDLASWNVTNYVLDGTGSSEYTYSYPSQKLSVVIPDEDSVEEAKELIASIMD